ncbi:hypothetical protein ACWEP5_36540 [Nocardia niigatensis]
MNPTLTPDPAPPRRPNTTGVGETPTLETTWHLAALAVGSLGDLLAFKNVVDLLLRGFGWQSWLLAASVTAFALTAAYWMGEQLGEFERGHRGARWGAGGAAAVWVFLGAMVVMVRWSSVTSMAASTGFAGTAAAENAVRQAHLGAALFGGLYLISGVTAALLARRLTHPLRRARGALRRQELVVTRARGHAERAHAVLAHHSGEFERDLARHNQARADRQALGAEAANYARVLMAQHMQDPRKTGVTESGPRPVPAQPVPSHGWDREKGSAA